jgi:YVTN family beta-propeller protein
VAALAAGAAALLGLVLRPDLERRVYAGSKPPATQSPADEQEYASPLEILLSPDGTRLYVLCQRSEDVRVLDAGSYEVIGTVAVGHVPRGMALSHAGDRLFVTNSWDDTVSVIDTRTLTVAATWSVGLEPSGVVEDAAGKYVFVANRISSDIAVLDAQTGAEEKRLLAGRGASYLTLSPDGRRIYATHIYPNLPPLRTGLENRTPPESEITVIDAIRAEVVDRIPLHSIAGVFHLAISADGHLGAAAELHPKNLVPLAHLEHGGAFADTLTLFGADVGKPVEIPLDELERYAARPFGVAITPDKSRLYVTSGGSEIVTVIDVARLLRYIHTHRGPYAEDLSASANYVVTRIPIGRDPRGVALTQDGSRLLVANRLEDTISVIDTRSNRVASTVALAGSTQLWALHFGEEMFAKIPDPSQGRTQCANCHIDERHRQGLKMSLTRPKQVLALRRGEQAFYTSRYSFQGQIGCANCHIDSTFDGLQWDLEPDGFGRDIVDNRLLEDVKDTEPYKWNGGNPNLPTECGPRTEKYFWRSENYDDRTLADLTAYINSLPPRPNRWRMPGNELTPAQERGEVIFDRIVDNFGKPIPLENRCSYCHSGPKGTSQKSFDVGTKKPSDDSGMLDTPQLTNIALTAPYLHDGSARTLEEIWTIYNPEDKHGRTNDLTKDELNDLIEYLRTR